MPKRPELERGGARHAGHRELARRVARHPRHADEAVDRRDVHDRPHRRPRSSRVARPHAMPRQHAVEVHRHDAAVVLERSSSSSTRGRHADAGVVHEDVEPAERLDGALDRARPTGSGSVTSSGSAIAARTDLVGDRAGAVVLTSVTTTRAPSSANRRASAAPCPCAAPVISATLPASRSPASRRPPPAPGSRTADPDAHRCRPYAGIARPPSTKRVWPVQSLASSEAKNTAVPARSSGSSVLLHRGHHRDHAR